MFVFHDQRYKEAAYLDRKYCGAIAFKLGHNRRGHNDIVIKRMIVSNVNADSQVNSTGSNRYNFRFPLGIKPFPQVLLKS